MTTDAATSPAARARPQTGHGGRVGSAGMWTFLATDAMGFGGLFIAYGALRVHAQSWPDPRDRLPIVPAALMTFALLASSLTMTLAARAESRGRRLGWLAATFALGLMFLGGVLAEYSHLAGTPGMGFSADLFASTFYVITGFHGLHVLGGVIALGLLAGKNVTGKTLEVMALYWHFVDLAWMPIFTFLYLVPSR